MSSSASKCFSSSPTHDNTDNRRHAVGHPENLATRRHRRCLVTKNTLLCTVFCSHRAILSETKKMKKKSKMCEQHSTVHGQQTFIVVPLFDLRRRKTSPQTDTYVRTPCFGQRRRRPSRLVFFDLRRLSLCWTCTQVFHLRRLLSHDLLYAIFRFRRVSPQHAHSSRKKIENPFRREKHPEQFAVSKHHVQRFHAKNFIHSWKHQCSTRPLYTFKQASVFCKKKKTERKNVKKTERAQNVYGISLQH